MDKGKIKIPKPSTKFMKVKCPGCGNEQVIFNSANRDVKCLACNKVLAESRGGRVKLKAKPVKEMD